jgi:hypothetical protein
MSADLISFDAVRASRYIEQAFAGFLIDPAETEYQQGYLAALLTLYQEGLGKGQHDDRLALLKAQVCK